MESAVSLDEKRKAFMHKINRLSECVFCRNGKQDDGLDYKLYLARLLMAVFSSLFFFNAKPLRRKDLSILPLRLCAFALRTCIIPFGTPALAGGARESAICARVQYIKNQASF